MRQALWLNIKRFEVVVKPIDRKWGLRMGERSGFEEALHISMVTGTAMAASYQ